MKIKVKNKLNNSIREVSISDKMLERATFNGIDKCTGPCKHNVEPDGDCPNGWPSRLLASGLI